MLGLKDFKVMNEEDKATFSKILADYASRRAAGAIQSQEAADAEAEATLVTEESSSTPSVASGIAEKNKQIMI